MQALSTKVQTLTDEVVKLIGHRLTSLAVIPTTHINGIAAITFTTLQYTPQKYQVVADHESEVHATTPVLDHVNAATKANYISTEKNKAYFHVSPSVGIRTQDIKLPSFDGLKSENIITRAQVLKLLTISLSKLLDIVSTKRVYWKLHSRKKRAS